MWRGYLDQPSGAKLQGWLAERDILLTQIHASGHATVADLQRLAEAFQPATVVPIHTQPPRALPQPLHERRVAPRRRMVDSLIVGKAPSLVPYPELTRRYVTLAKANSKERLG